MKKFHISLAITLLVAALLITGSPLLLIGLDAADTIPSGTFITWLGLVSLPLTMLWGFKTLQQPTNSFTRTLATLLKISIALSVLWVPVSYLLAGNISFNFSEKATFQGGFTAMQWFWRYTYGIVIFPLVLLMTLGLHAVAKKIRS